jgi:hypothetical protein
MEKDEDRRRCVPILEYARNTSNFSATDNVSINFFWARVEEDILVGCLVAQL